MHLTDILRKIMAEAQCVSIDGGVDIANERNHWSIICANVIILLPKPSWHSIKTVGTYLDPIADKFFINSIAISLWYSGILPTPLVFLWASKDFLLLGGMGWYLYQEHRTINFFSNSIHTIPLTVTPSTLGKANTGLQFATLAIGILTPVVPPEYLQPFVLQSLCWVTGASSIGTTLSYATGGKGFKYTSKKP